MKNCTVLIFSFLFVVLAAADSTGEVLKYNSPFFLASPLIIPENIEVRREYRDIIFGSNTDIINAAEDVHLQSYSDHRVRFQTRKNDRNLYLLFTNEENFKFPLYSAGSYIIKKERESGNFVQVKIFIRSDPGSFIRVFPWGERSRMDVYIHGYPAYMDVNLHYPFEEVLTTPFIQLLESSGTSVDWALFTADGFTPGSGRVQSMVEEIRKALPGLADEDDGAMDSDGVYKYIETLLNQEAKGLNCSGFAKWVVDGIYFDKHHGYLDIEKLKTKPENLRGNRWSDRYEDERDPFFGLDWTRNLASAVQKSGNLENWDVREIPFLTYVEDVGYPVEHLSFILYYLAAKDPGYFYLASLNRPFGEEPTLRQHFHIALLFPYFDEEGKLHKVVMERTVETSLKEFVSRNERDYVHLVRMKAPSDYYPPKPN